MIKYELKFKIDGFPWRVFDTYSDRDLEELKRYKALLESQKFNAGVKAIKITTIREEVAI